MGGKALSEYHMSKNDASARKAHMHILRKAEVLPVDYRDSCTCDVLTLHIWRIYLKRSNGRATNHIRHIERTRLEHKENDKERN